MDITSSRKVGHNELRSMHFREFFNSLVLIRLILAIFVSELGLNIDRIFHYDDV